jgi:hypothetical protein
MKRSAKTTVIRARCDESLKTGIERIALISQLDTADIIRIACNNYIQQFQKHGQQFAAQAGN